MSRAERRAEQDEKYRQHFLAGFKALHDRGQVWVALDEAQPAAAQQDYIFIAKRRARNDAIYLLTLTARKPEDAPKGLNYPPRGRVHVIIDQLVEQGLVEAAPNALARYSGTYDSPEPSTIYRLTPEPEHFDTEPQLDVVTTTS